MGVSHGLCSPILEVIGKKEPPSEGPGLPKEVTPPGPNKHLLPSGVPGQY